MTGGKTVIVVCALIAAFFAGARPALGGDAACEPEVMGTLRSSQPAGIAIEGGHAFVADGRGMQVFDLSTPSSPTIVSEITLDSREIYTVAVDGGLASVANYDREIFIVDVSDRSAPVVVSSIETSRDVEDMWLSGDVLYAAIGSHGFAIYDVSDPASPAPLRFVDTPDYAHGLFVVDDTVYVADDRGGLLMYRVSGAGAASLVGSVLTGGDALDVHVDGDLAYVADSREGVLVYDVREPADIMLVSSVNVASGADHVAVEGGVMYASDNRDLKAFDVSDPSSPTPLGDLFFSESVDDLAMYGSHAYAAFHQLGVYSIKQAGPDGLVVTDRMDPLGLIQDVAMNGSLLHVADLNALHTYRVSSDGAPVEVSVFETNRGPECVVAHEGLVYLKDRSVLSILDYSDAASPAVLGELTLPGTPRDVVVEGSRAYFAIAFDGVVVVDVSDPAHPFYVYDLSVQFPTSVAARGDAVYCLEDEELSTYNVFDRVRADQTSRIDDSTYGTWLTRDGRRAYVSAGWNIDVLDLTARFWPAVIGEIRIGYAPHRFHVQNERLFVRGSQSEFEIYDISDIENAQLIGTSPVFLGVSDVSGSLLVGASRDGDLTVVDVRGCFNASADIDSDGTVGAGDLAVVLAAWGETFGSPGDLDGDGTVGSRDLAIVLAAWDG